MNREELCEALRSGWYLTTKEIDAILADRDFFRPYLKNALAHRAKLGGVPESPVDATDCQAVFFLTEMEDAGIIPDLLSCLSMSEEDLRRLYGDTLTEHMWLPFAKLGHSHLEKLFEFVTDASVDLFARHAVVGGVVAMHHFHPETRAATVGFIERLLNQTDTFPIDHLAGILCDCADSGLTELADRAEQFTATMDDEEAEYPMATADDVRNAFRDGFRKDFISGRPHDVYGVNEQWQRWTEPRERGDEPLIPDWLKNHTKLIEKVGTAAAARLEERSSEDSIAALREQYELATRLSQVITTEEEMDQLEDITDEDVTAWLLDLPFQLARVGLVQEAVEVGRVWAIVTERANFLGDRAVILAEAGWREEGHRQIEEALHEFPDDVWVRIKIGDAHRVLGELDKAEGCYRHALTMSRERYDREGVLERLIPMLQELGRGDEALALETEEKSREKKREFARLTDKIPAPAGRTVRSDGRTGLAGGPTGTRGSLPKVGRNDPCPCGSGKKYKKCHGA